MTRMVVAYSGTPASAGAVERLVSSNRGEVVTLTLDLGQGKELEAARDRALAIGAVRAHVLDAHDLFVREYVVRALKAGALADGGRSLVPLLTRPLIARKLVEIARIEQAAEVAHVCGERDDLIAIAVRALAPDLVVVALPRAGNPEPAAAPRAASLPAEPALVEIAFERGVPAALNGIVMPLLDVIGSLAIIAGSHRVDPACVLSDAHADLQRAIAPGEREELSRRYREVIETGRWFDPVREALDRQIAKAQEKVSGAVRLKVFDGRCEIIDREAASAPVKTVPLVAADGGDIAPRRRHSL